MAAAENCLLKTRYCEAILLLITDYKGRNSVRTGRPV